MYQHEYQISLGKTELETNTKTSRKLVFSSNSLDRGFKENFNEQILLKIILLGTNCISSIRYKVGNLIKKIRVFYIVINFNFFKIMN